MEKDDIKLDDWERILIGNNPWGFTVEVFIRTLVIYFFLVLVMRLLGKRMNAQLNITDLAVMLTLGAIASVPMQDFNAGILPGVILLIAILLLHQGLNLLSFEKRNVEKLTKGKMELLIKNGLVDNEQLKKMRISKDQLFSLLRSKGVRHLGQVKRMYSEADGQFSVFQFEEPRMGFSVYPREDKGVPPSTKEMEERMACGYCGLVIEKAGKGEACSNCGNKDWVPAIK
jgi:uncharacterized membrane protein YcaP (DUF421 family)